MRVGLRVRVELMVRVGLMVRARVRVRGRVRVGVGEAGADLGFGWGLARQALG